MSGLLREPWPGLEYDGRGISHRGRPSSEGALEMKARDLVSLPKIELVRSCPAHARVQLDRAAALVASQVDEVLVEQPAVSTGAPALRGDQVVDVEVLAVDEIREQPVTGRRTAVFAVEHRSDSVTALVPGGVARVKLVFGQFRSKLVHDRKDRAQSIVSRWDLANVHGL